MPQDFESEVLSCLEKQVQIDSERKALLALPVKKSPVVPLQQTLPMTSFLGRLEQMLMDTTVPKGTSRTNLSNQDGGDQFRSFTFGLYTAR
eukprot:4846693-Amphidinium_carterae.1